MSLIAPAIQFISKAIVCSRRINDFLQANELKKERESEKDFQISIILENAHFSWNNQKEHLKNITLEVRQGEHRAVVGPVGCGKSSLLAAILGEMNLLEGYRKVNGTIAYVSQISWILNHTVRANILYGLEYNRNKYDKILRACELKKDIFTLPRSDATVVGENGASLSGGQRARICLARALYQDCDIYLLDEPFSAVDATIAGSMYE
ncbi:hypothetical protein Angca_005361, partial [Angiostrongylus cantonensis]